MSLDLPADIYDRYSSGWCMHLAAALHRKLGWKIQAVVTKTCPPNYIEHAWVVDPSGTKMLDIDGYYSVNKNGWIHPANTLHEDLTEDQLKGLTRDGFYNPSEFDDDEWNRDVEQALIDIQKSKIVASIFSKNEKPQKKGRRHTVDSHLRF